MVAMTSAEGEATPPPGSVWSTCKDCNKVYAYSATSARADAVARRSPPERCGSCAATNATEIRSIGVAYSTVRARDGGPVPIGISTGRLGKISHPPREHIEIPAQPIIDEEIKKAGVNDQNLDDLFSALSRRQIVLVEGGTGSGKSTYVPCRLIEPGTERRRDLWSPRGPVVITQPRIQATIAIPKRVAELLGCGVGPRMDVGYKYGGADQSDLSRNRIVFVTDGVLLGWLLDGSKLDRIAAIVVDEAHERSLRIDIILALLRRMLPSYPHLKLLVASATIDTARFREFLGDPDAGSDPGSNTVLDAQVPVIRCAGMTQGYDLKYRDDCQAGRGPIGAYDEAVRSAGKFPKNARSRIVSALVERIVELLTETPNDREDILGFLATTADVQDACRQVNERIDGDPAMGHVDVLPLYRQLPETERSTATEEKSDPARRRVIIATNIAETSLTIEELGYVVDSGLIVQTEWDDREESTEYPIVLHSQSGCRQRWGRVGRVRPGKVRTLYTLAQFEQFAPHTLPEVQRAGLDDLVLRVKTAGFEPTELAWLSEPVREAIEAACNRLARDGALASEGNPTAFGLEMQRLGLSANDAQLMIEADRFACSVEMATVLAMQDRTFNLNVRNRDSLTRFRAARASKVLREGLLDDIELLMKVYGGWKGEFDTTGDHDPEAWSARWFISHEAMREAEQKRGDLLKNFSKHGKDTERRAIDFSILERVRVLLALHVPRRRYRWNGDGYFSPDGVRAVLDRDSCAVGGTAELVALQVGGRSSAPIIKRAAAIESMPGNQPRSLIHDALAMRGRLRNADGSLVHDRAETWRRILIDQLAPPGLRFLSEPAGGGAIMLTQVITEGSPSAGQRPESEAPEDATGRLEDIGPPVREGVTHMSDEGDPPEVPPDTNGSAPGDDLTDEDNDEADDPKARLLGVVTPVPARIDPPGSSLNSPIVEVTGYDREAVEGPLAIVRDSPDGLFTALSERCPVGGEIELEVMSLEFSDPNDDGTAVLVTREVSSGAEVLLEPEDLTLDGFGWVLRHIPSGARIMATVVSIDPALRQVRATVLPQIIRHRQELFTNPQRMAKATIGRIAGRWKLEIEAFLGGVSEPARGILHTVRIPERRLCRDGAAYHAGQTIDVGLSLDHGSVEFPKQTVTLNAEALHRSLHYDQNAGRLQFRGQMSFDEYVSASARASSRVLSDHLHKIFRDSNRLRARELDIRDDHAFLQQFRAGSDIKVRIQEIEPTGVICLLPDGRSRRIARSDLDWDTSTAPSTVGAVGETITARVVADGNTFKLSLKELRPDPLDAIVRLAGSDEWVAANITGGNDGKGLYLELPGGVSAFIPWFEVPGGNHDGRARFPRGASLRVRILSVDPDSRRIMLTAIDRGQSRAPAVPRERGPRPAAPQPRRSPPALIAPIQQATPDLPIVAVVQVTLQAPAGSKLGSLVAVERAGPVSGHERSRVKDVLGGGWLEFVEWSDDPLRLVRNAMLIHTAAGERDIVRKVDWSTLENERMAGIVHVDPDAVAYAIGPGGMRVRLAARLLGLAWLKIVPVA